MFRTMNEEWPGRALLKPNKLIGVEFARTRYALDYGWKANAIAAIQLRAKGAE
jgi:hypothetical protein